MPRHVLTEAVPGPERERLQGVALVLLEIRVLARQPPLRREDIWIRKVGRTPVGGVLVYRDTRARGEPSTTNHLTPSGYKPRDTYGDGWVETQCFLYT